MLALSEETVAKMIDFVDRNVRREGCDHTHRFTYQWVQENSINWDDILDTFEQRGAFCDCEVVLNLQGTSLIYKPEVSETDIENRWLLPPKFVPTIKTTDRVLVARDGIGKNNYALDGEWLVPAPQNEKPRKRVRKSTHFFIGIESGLPAEIGFVDNIPLIQIPDLIKKIHSSDVPELKDSDIRLAGFISQKIAKMRIGASVGTDIVDRVGVSGKHRELTIHRVILRQ